MGTSASSPTIEAPPASGRAALAVDVEHLSVHFRIRVDSPTLRGDLARLVRRKKAVERLVPALEDLTFSVPKGSVLAIIGRNGAGKTTLLRAIAGVLAPDAGRIVVRGQLNLLIPGAGFNAALTGRENITLGGLASGMSDARIAEIAESVAEFAELGEYLDYPIRTYSSGMRSRLGFAVAAHLDPDVLLIDEALSAGDAGFAEKAGRKMAELCGHGRTILLVTHGLSSVRSMATDAMWMHQGRIVAHDTPEDVVARYMRWCRLENLDLLSDPFT